MLKRLMCWWSGHVFMDKPTLRHYRNKRWYHIGRRVCWRCDMLQLDQYEAFEWEA